MTCPVRPERSPGCGPRAQCPHEWRPTQDSFLVPPVPAQKSRQCTCAVLVNKHRQTLMHHTGNCTTQANAPHSCTTHANAQTYTHAHTRTPWLYLVKLWKILWLIRSTRYPNKQKALTQTHKNKPSQSPPPPHMPTSPQPPTLTLIHTMAPTPHVHVNPRTHTHTPTVTSTITPTPIPIPTHLHQLLQHALQLTCTGCSNTPCNIPAPAAQMLKHTLQLTCTSCSNTPCSIPAPATQMLQHTLQHTCTGCSNTPCNVPVPATQMLKHTLQRTCTSCSNTPCSIPVPAARTHPAAAQLHAARNHGSSAPAWRLGGWPGGEPSTAAKRSTRLRLPGGCAHLGGRMHMLPQGISACRG